ncbi:MAG: hypothetical protein Q8N19_02230 [Phenylobacterium sp.]|uniref:hypothetical protein n=1 Tax=Phenylobacterium sp. TaxID=1871053 RepID=UPI00273349C7|nr:hypothetical protein [Phenylobacterium sp.]MDP3115911.1 hypothetical protein [Phenylobacterium sp.]
MSNRRKPRLRSFLAMCCLALMAVLTHQGAVASVDKVQHALGVEHAPNALAGAVSFDHDHDHDADQHGDDHAAADADHGRPDSSDQGPDDGVRNHHHAGEASQFAALEGERLPALILATGAALDLPLADGPESWLSARLERPPKPLSI